MSILGWPIDPSESAFNEGDRVWYYADDEKIAGTITDHSNEHDGDIIYGVACDNGDQRWGYADQFEIIIPIDKKLRRLEFGDVRACSASRAMMMTRCRIGNPATPSPVAFRRRYFRVCVRDGR